MLKREFIAVYIKPYLSENNKPKNCAMWNDQINYCIKSELLPERAGNWTKEPREYFGEVKKMKTIKAFYTLSGVFCAGLMGSIEVTNIKELAAVVLFAAAFLGTVIYINLTVKD